MNSSLKCNKFSFTNFLTQHIQIKGNKNTPNFQNHSGTKFHGKSFNSPVGQTSESVKLSMNWLFFKSPFFFHGILLIKHETIIRPKLDIATGHAYDQNS